MKWKSKGQSKLVQEWSYRVRVRQQKCMGTLAYWCFSCLSLVWYNCYLSWSAGDWRILIAWWGPRVALGGFQPQEKHTRVHRSFGAVFASKVNLEMTALGFIWFCPPMWNGGAPSWVLSVQGPAKGLLLLPDTTLELGKAGMPQWHLKKQGELSPEHGTAAFPRQGQFRTQMLHSSYWKMALVGTWGTRRCCISASGTVTHSPSLRSLMLLFKMWLFNLDHFTKTKSGSNCKS